MEDEHDEHALTTTPAEGTNSRPRKRFQRGTENDDPLRNKPALSMPFQRSRDAPGTMAETRQAQPQGVMGSPARRRSMLRDNNYGGARPLGPRPLESKRYVWH
jgi:hypothetical protein